ncbi:MAG: hypothetical protein LC772_10880 [Chloroflexi bacterium]|nr:hypothetical protein [Chloroflexota bacterium]
MMQSLLGYLFVCGIAAVAAAVYAGWRLRVVWQWRQAAILLDAAYTPRGGLKTGFIDGVSHGRRLHLVTSVSYEDGPAYHHTAAAITCENPGSVVLALRRKSVLEQYVGRHDVLETPTGDQDFDALFFMASNDRTVIDTLVDPSIRQRLKRLDDIEVYVRGDQVVVRRSGERKAANELVEMAGIGAVIADILATFPVRRRSLVEQMEDEELLKEGI